MQAIQLLISLLIFTLTGCGSPERPIPQMPPAPPAQSVPVQPQVNHAVSTGTALESPNNLQPTQPPQPTQLAANQWENKEIRIRLTFEDNEATATLEDNPATQSLLSQLPATVTFDDFAGAEKIAYFSEDLSTEDGPRGYDPVIGDITCYGPWGNMAIFYGDQPYASGLIPMGKIETGIDDLAEMGGDVEVTIVLVQ